MTKRNFQPGRVVKGNKKIIISDISVNPTPNPLSLMFEPTPKVEFMPNGETKHFPNVESAVSSPLAKQLFQIEGVQSVFFGHHFVSINRQVEVDWSFIQSEIKQLLRHFFLRGLPIFSEPIKSPNKQTTTSQDGPNDENDEYSLIVTHIKDILERMVKPAVRQDGGDVDFLGFNESEGVVLLRMQGSCSGCPSSNATLKGGIEKTLMHFCSQVQSVIAVDDKDLSSLDLRKFQRKAK